MGTDHILALLISERDKLDGAIEALQDQTKAPAADRKAVVPPVERESAPVPKAAKRKLSAAGRRAIIEGTKKRWAAIKAAKAAIEAPVAAAPKSAPVKAPAAAKHKSASVKTAAFRKKMSDRMKAAWAARKKKTAAKGK